jgi:hypothetical protein
MGRRGLSRPARLRALVRRTWGKALPLGEPLHLERNGDVRGRPTERSFLVQRRRRTGPPDGEPEEPASPTSQILPLSAGGRASTTLSADGRGRVQVRLAGRAHARRRWPTANRSEVHNVCPSTTARCSKSPPPARRGGGLWALGYAGSQRYPSTGRAIRLAPCGMAAALRAGSASACRAYRSGATTSVDSGTPK